MGVIRGYIGVFLANYGVVGKSVPNDSADCLLRGEVGLSNQIGGALFSDVEAAGPLLDSDPPGANRLFANSHILG